MADSSLKRRAANASRSEPAAKQSAPPPPSSLVTVLRGDCLCRLLSYCTTDQKLQYTQMVNRHWQTATLKSTAWARTTKLIVYDWDPCNTASNRLRDSLFVIFPVQLSNRNATFYEKCEGLLKVMNCLCHLRCVYLTANLPYRVQKQLEDALPQMGQLKLLHFRLHNDCTDLAEYAHSLIGIVQHYPRLKHQWKLRIDIRSSTDVKLQQHWFTLRTLMFAARSGCTIKKLSLNYVTFANDGGEQSDSELISQAQYAQLMRAFEGVRVQEISATPELFGITHGTQSFIVDLLHTIARGSLYKFKWRRQVWINDENDVGQIGDFLTAVQPTAFSELISYDCHADCCREFRSDIGFYNSSERLLTIVTEFLSKMPKLLEFTFQPCDKLAEPYTFQKESFLLLIECFMQRAKQHKQGFKATLIKVVNFNETLHVTDLQMHFPTNQYSVMFGIKNSESAKKQSLYLKVVHLASDRALVLSCYNQTHDH